MKRVLLVLALAGVTFVNGFLATILAAGLTSLDVTALQAAAVGAAANALAIIANGLGRLHAYLSARVGEGV